MLRQAICTCTCHWYEYEIIITDDVFRFLESDRRSNSLKYSSSSHEKWYRAISPHRWLSTESIIEISRHHCRVKLWNPYRDKRLKFLRMKTLKSLWGKFICVTEYDDQQIQRGREEVGTQSRKHLHCLFSNPG